MQLFPPIPLSDWADTKATLHRFCQIVGKIRLASSVRRNHWWNVPFHLTGRGITTRPMGQVDGNPIFTIDFDFVDHQLRVHSLDGAAISFPLSGRSVASFYRSTLDALDAVGVQVGIDRPNPFDLPDAERRFADDTEHAVYDPGWVTRYWQVLSLWGSKIRLPGADLRLYAARSYSLISPPRTGRRLIRWRSRSRAG